MKKNEHSFETCSTKLRPSFHDHKSLIISTKDIQNNIYPILEWKECKTMPLPFLTGKAI